VSDSKGRIDYSQRLNAIRPFVSFDHDLRKPLTSAAKAQISRYYFYIQKLTVRPHQVYRTRNADHLRTVQEFAQHDPNRFQQLRVAFVPNDGAERMRIRFDAKGRVHGETVHLTKIAIPLDVRKLIKGGAKYIDEQIDAAPPAKRYVVQAGEFEVPFADMRSGITKRVVRYMEKYGADKYDADDKNSHYFGNWMFGITGFNFTEQSDMMAYRTAQRKATKVRSRERVNQNKREKRARENPPGFWVNDSIRKAKRARPPQPEGWRQVNQREYYRKVYAEGFKEIADRTKR